MSLVNDGGFQNLGLFEHVKGPKHAYFFFVSTEINWILISHKSPWHTCAQIIFSFKLLVVVLDALVQA